MFSESEKIMDLIKYAVYCDPKIKHNKIHLMGCHKLFHGVRTYNKPVDSWSFFMTKNEAKLFANTMHNENPKLLPITPCKLCGI